MTGNIEHNKWKLAGAGCVVLFIILLAGYVKPLIEETVQIYNDWQVEEQKIRAAANWESRIKQLNKQQHKLEAYFSEVFVSLPEDDQMSTIVDEIFRKAKQYDVEITQMRPSKRVEHPSHIEIPVMIYFSGAYHETGRFINAIEHSKYLMKVDELGLKSTETSVLEGRALIKVIILNEKLEGAGTDA